MSGRDHPHIGVLGYCAEDVVVDRGITRPGGPPLHILRMLRQLGATPRGLLRGSVSGAAELAGQPVPGEPFTVHFAEQDGVIQPRVRRPADFQPWSIADVSPALSGVSHLIISGILDEASPELIVHLRQELRMWIGVDIQGYQRVLSADGGIGSRPASAAMFSHIDLLKCNAAEFARQFPGGPAAVRPLTAAGLTILETIGSDGARLHTDAGMITVGPPRQLPPGVSTVGAGDAALAAFTFYLSLGASPAEALGAAQWAIVDYLIEADPVRSAH